ncbi:MAG TPA: hypothetical protein VMV45_20210 [Casimicrobiaceae bacterium]|nr:hypothetical protein [Casimicrobiaceae bacterium]
MLVPQDANRLAPADLVVDLAMGGRIVGDGPINYVCPHCRGKMLVGMATTPMASTVFRCASCRNYSRTERRLRARTPDLPGPPPM